MKLLNSELTRIQSISNTRLNDCDCSTCKAMCSKAPCLGTPEDILKLIEHGYIARLKVTHWAAGIPYGMNRIIRMVQPEQKPDGKCTFLSEEGLCQLHELGLKPTEGKLASHQPTAVDHFSKTLSAQIAQSWEAEENQLTLVKVLTHMLKYSTL